LYSIIQNLFFVDRSGKLRSERKFAMNIIEIEGIGSKYAAKLNEAGIITLEGLLKTGATPKGRKDLSEKTGIDQTYILEWVNLADLFRISGIGSEYSDLLEEAGVDTVVELSTRRAENLILKLTEVNTKKQLVRKMPSESQVADWIDQAKKLPRVVSY